MMHGQSSGAIRAGAFAVAEPARVERLVLDAFTYTGENAPEIERRRKVADQYRANPRRPISLASIQRIFDRDKPGTSEPEVPKALAEYELKFGNEVPSGTYLDMAVNMPMVDPLKLTCPVCLIRAEHDGNASEEELLRFYAALPNKDKQFVMIAGHGALRRARHQPPPPVARRARLPDLSADAQCVGKKGRSDRASTNRDPPTAAPGIRPPSRRVLVYSLVKEQRLVAADDARSMRAWAAAGISSGRDRSTW